MRTHFPGAVHEVRPRTRAAESVVAAWPATILFLKEKENLSTEAKCPFLHTQAGAPGNAKWWPNQLNVKILNQNSPLSDPMGKEFNYAKHQPTRCTRQASPRSADA